MTPNERALTERIAAAEYVIATVLGALCAMTKKPEQLAETLRKQAEDQLYLATPTQPMDAAKSDQFAANVAENVDRLFRQTIDRLRKTQKE